MKKILFGAIVGVGLVGGGWMAAREKFAQDGASSYLAEKEIPRYHALSFHGRDDLNLIGYCKPCAQKAKDVLAAKAQSAVDSEKKKLEEILST